MIACNVEYFLDKKVSEDVNYKIMNFEDARECIKKSLDYDIKEIIDNKIKNLKLAKKEFDYWNHIKKTYIYFNQNNCPVFIDFIFSNKIHTNIMLKKYCDGFECDKIINTLHPKESL